MSTVTKIEMKKHTKTEQSGEKEKHRKKDRAIADRSGTSSRSISKNLEDNGKKQSHRRSIAPWKPIDWPILVKESPPLRRSIAAYEPIDRAFVDGRDRCAADRSKESVDRSAKSLDLKWHRFPDFKTPNFHHN